MTDLMTHLRQQRRSRSAPRLRGASPGVDPQLLTPSPRVTAKPTPGHSSKPGPLAAGAALLPASAATNFNRRWWS
jgi:hypothetical protein